MADVAAKLLAPSWAEIPTLLTRLDLQRTSPRGKFVRFYLRAPLRLVHGGAVFDGTLIGSLLRLAAIAHIAALSIRVPAIHVARSATHRPLTLPGHHPRG